MPGLFDMVRRIEELHGEIKSADDIVKEDTVQRDRAKRAYDATEAKLKASIATAVDKRTKRDELADKIHIEAKKAGEPLDPADHTPMQVEAEDEGGS